MLSFTYIGRPSRVIFGSGTLGRLPDEMRGLGISKALVLSTTGRSKEAGYLAGILGDTTAAVFTGARMHTPVDLTEKALALLLHSQADGIIAFGGGSSIGLSKALALRTDLPQIVIPTTYSGSEMTPVVGETTNGQKTMTSSAKVLPEVVIYDVDLTLTLPPLIAGVSGVNAIAHAVEALYAKDRNPVVRLMALEAIGNLYDALPTIVRTPDDAKARSQALYGAWLGGLCLGSVGMALHHKLCHVLGGAFDLPHAETHAAVLPHVLAYNARAVPEAINALRYRLGNPDPAMALYNLVGRLGAASALSELGMPSGCEDAVVEQIITEPYWNPRGLEPIALKNMLERAYSGDAPRG